MPVKKHFFIIFNLILMFSGVTVHAQEDPPGEPGSLIETSPTEQSDAKIAARLNEIFDEISSLEDISVTVQSGVVTLSGATASTDAAARAEALASRVDGVVTVENNISRDVSVSTRVSPTLSEAENYVTDAIRFLPLLGLAFAAFLLIAAFGWWLAKWSPLWRRVTPNAFVAELAATTIRAIFVVIAAIAALSLIGATALLGAFLGAAGVLGLAVGFAVRDTIENYISSVMLSLRQPFRPNDHVVIDDYEGRVIRLTSRATILMTLQGNHLRIPNSKVFKAVILNYTRNPERRFDFELGVDADDDPLAAIETGLNAIRPLPFVLKEPSPLAFIKQVGDSNIVILFAAWIDQSSTDYAKSRSIALTKAKNALEDAGFALPEPIYRLRFDTPTPQLQVETIDKEETSAQAETSARASPVKRETRDASSDIDVEPDQDLTQKVDSERREEGGEDLLEENAPIE